MGDRVRVTLNDGMERSGLTRHALEEQPLCVTQHLRHARCVDLFDSHA